MPDEIPKRKIIICSKCGKEITTSKEKITDKQNVFLCDACYQNDTFPKLKFYDCEIFDIDTSDQ